MNSPQLLSKETLLSRNDTGVLFTRLGNELVMMDVESGDYVSMNEVGADIWEMIEKPINVGNLIKELVNAYEVSEEKCETDILPYLHQMIESRLVKII